MGNGEESGAEAVFWAPDEGPGFRRRRSGRGFHYYSDSGKALRRADLERIKSLVIPPAWTGVWISPHPRAHIQATGRDARGRKQYIYHPEWRAQRDANKFGRMLAFGEALPRIREAVDGDLRSPVLSPRRVIAGAVRLLDQVPIRVGNEEYARTNGTYGLTTLRSEHVEVEGNHLHIRFVGKGGKEHEVTIRDPRLARVVRACEELPGQALFQYRNGHGAGQIRSDDINDYLREVSRGDFTAKDFRTWTASALAAGWFAVAEWPESPQQRKRIANGVTRQVAGVLGNTVSVCRQCYIHPAVFTAYEDGSLNDAWRRNGRRWLAGSRDAHEALLLHLLKRTSAAPEPACATA
jgi:DNA topoisomerase-1